ncbi:MAG: hypothetical protein MUF07_10745 [Steroidobacteraceae bacterium]|jgi:hypothetical protein|nr:hypothetical protein [Steroidobacteraceae bacterium]
MPKGLLRLGFVVELVACLALPVVLLLAGTIMLPILAIALPSDMADSPRPREPLLLVVQLLVGLAGGFTGLRAVFHLARRVLTGRPVGIGPGALAAMLLAFAVALGVAYVVTGGPSSRRAGILLLALPAALLAHLVHLNRDVWAGSR